MDQCQQQQRRAAARAFMQSLNQLEETLLPDLVPPAPAVAPEPQASHPRPMKIDSPKMGNPKMDKLEESFALAPSSGQSAALSSVDQSLDQSFEDAVADIEQFIQDRQPPE
jgi:hypothetical protein